MLKRLSILFVAVLAFLVVSCTPPVESQTTSQTFLFTWPGDDGNVGTCSSYEIRLSTQTVVGTDTLTWWNNAPIRRTAPPPTPKVAGTPDSVNVIGLLPSTTYHAIMRTADEVPNHSGFSNIATVTTGDIIRPNPITNLRPSP